MLLMLESEPMKEAFISLWEHTTGTTVLAAMDELAKQAPEAAPSLEFMVVPSAFFRGSNNRPIPAVATWRPQQTDAFLEMRPFQPGDEAYLVYQFLEENYPQGSEHEIRFVGIQGGSKSIWSQLIAYVLGLTGVWVVLIPGLDSVSRRSGQDILSANTSLQWLDLWKLAPNPSGWAIRC